MRICPGCGGKFDRLLAVSRLDNKTMLCDACGMKEAIEAMEGKCVDFASTIIGKKNMEKR